MFPLRLAMLPMQLRSVRAVLLDLGSFTCSAPKSGRRWHGPHTVIQNGTGAVQGETGHTAKGAPLLISALSDLVRWVWDLNPR